jgi:anti-anti-sigma factor
LVKISSGTDAEAEPPLADILWELMRQHFTHRLVLELDQVEVLNSFVIGELVQLSRRVSEYDGVMRLCGLSKENLRVLRSCQLDDRFLPYRNRREAVMADGSPRLPR